MGGGEGAWMNLTLKDRMCHFYLKSDFGQIKTNIRITKKLNRGKNRDHILIFFGLFLKGESRILIHIKVQVEEQIDR